MLIQLTNMDIALFALYKLGGVSKKIHTEYIAWEAFKLAKERFSWRLPEFRKRGFPDKTPVRFALEQAKKKEYGMLVFGRAGGDVGGPLEGWRFTPQGVAWIKKSETRISKALEQTIPDLPKHRVERFIKKLKSEPLFKCFQENETLNDVSNYMFTDMLVCAPDASKDIIREKFSFLLATAELISDKEIVKFLKACEEKFSSLIID